MSTLAKSTLAQKATTASFTRLTPDHAINTPAKALANEDNIVRTPRMIRLGAFSWTVPEPREKTMFLTASDQALRDLGLPASEAEIPQFRRIVSGEAYYESDFAQSLPVPYSQAYAGWQFGQFAGQLGDGRAHSLFEVAKLPEATSSNRDRPVYEVQLKGSGMTPYLRFADGKAVLRLSIREYIISEHLHSLGIPTTRALALTYLPKTYARRGSSAEKCAVVARFAELWVRLGTFDLSRWRSDMLAVRELSDYVINNLFTITNGTHTERFSHFSAAVKARPDLVSERLGLLTDYDRMYFEIVVRNAKTTAMWQCYGFLNGVLNTDNTSVLGLSMDFGPFAIMDRFDPNYTLNSEDESGRYSYANTPTAIWWNLTRLGEDVAILIGAGADHVNSSDIQQGVVRPDMEERLVRRCTHVIEDAGELYQYVFTRQYVETFLQRLGLDSASSSADVVADPDAIHTDLVAPMLTMLHKVRCDYNKFFLALHDADVARLDFDDAAFARSILLKEVSESEQYDRDEIAQLVVEWLQKYKVYVSKYGQDKKASSRANPRFLPRNWIFDEVFEQTKESEGADLSYLHKLEKMAFNPFDPEKWGDDLKDVEARWLLQSDIGDDRSMLQCSCSS